jgi:hypothetical protein
VANPRDFVGLQCAQVMPLHCRIVEGSLRLKFDEVIFSHGSQSRCVGGLNRFNTKGFGYRQNTNRRGIPPGVGNALPHLAEMLG